jgi:hypothetical protein
MTIAIIEKDQAKLAKDPKNKETGKNIGTIKTALTPARKLGRFERKLGSIFGLYQRASATSTAALERGVTLSSRLHRLSS